MSGRPLAGRRVLVTRPRHQADALLDAVRDAGGEALPFPVIDIEPRDTAAVAADCAALPEADIVVFVSANAVRHGVAGVTDGARLAAIGQATATALRAAGRDADILADEGYDSEALLALPAMQDVAGSNVRILRGDDGRELLGRTLANRGARVDHVTVYHRRAVRHDEAAVARVADDLAAGRIHYVIAMSVESLDKLVALLPPNCLERARGVLLVSPSARVIQTVADRLPGLPALAAAGPGAADLVAAMAGDAAANGKQQ